MKTNLLRRTIQTIALTLIIFALSCGNTQKGESQISQARQAWEDGGHCWGEATNPGEAACLTQTTENDCLAFSPLNGNSDPVFSIQICVWNNSSCHISNAICRDQPNETGCTNAGKTGYEYGECRWLPSPNCIGNIAPACTAYGIDESACNALSPMDCQWIDDACIPETNCEDFAFVSDCSAVINAQLSNVSYCAWDTSSCIGNIAPACTAYGIDESACNALSPMDCQWIDDACIPETNCEALNQVACDSMVSNNLPAITTCTLRLNEVNGTCVGSPYEAGEGQCAYWTDQSECESQGLINGGGHLLFPEALCEWVDSKCQVKSNACTVQTNQQLCGFVTPRVYDFGLCSWITN